MIDMDLLKVDSLTEMINSFEPEELVFSRSGVLPVVTLAGEQADWDVLGIDRDIDKFQHRGAPATPRKLKVIAHQNARLPYTFISKMLQAQVFSDLRTAGQTQKGDAAGQQLAREQQDFKEVIERQNELMYAGSLQGGFTIKIDDLDVTVSTPIPPTNQFTTDGAGGTVSLGGDWEDPSQDIMGNLRDITLAGSENSGRTLGTAFCGARVSAAIIKNDLFKEMFGGTSDGTGVMRSGFLGRFWGFDWFKADHTYIDSAGATKKYLDPKKVVFCPKKGTGSTWGHWREGSVWTPNDDDSGFTERLGVNSWSDISKNPVGATLFAACRRMPIIQIPSAIVTAKVIA